jgi:hypothetical protein
MKINILTFALCVALAFVSVSLLGKDNKHVPNKEAKKWHNNLHKSPYVLYENFDGCMFYVDNLLPQVSDTIHLKFFMGCSNPDLSNVTYTLFALNIYGEEEIDGYTNDYSTIRYFDGATWIPCELDKLKTWSDNWKNNLSKNELPYIKAFVVPNDDVRDSTLKSPIYLSFGLKTVQQTDSVKLLLGNKKYKPTDLPSTTDQLEGETDVYMDACMPCPKVCGKNEE